MNTAALTPTQAVPDGIARSFGTLNPTQARLIADALEKGRRNHKRDALRLGFWGGGQLDPAGLWVSPGDAEQAREQLRQYRRESVQPLMG